MNLPIKGYILPALALLLILIHSGSHEPGSTICAGLNFIALFAALFYGTVNSSHLLGKELSFHQYRHDNSLGNIFPSKGKVIKNVTLSGEDDWLLVELNKAFAHNTIAIKHVMIKRNDKQPIVPNKANQLVYFKLVPDINVIREEGNDKTDFPFEVWALCK